MSRENIAPIARKSNVVVQVLEKEVLIYDLNENSAFSLNETSALIWQLCDGNNTVTEIAAFLSEKFDSPINNDFVWLALEQFKKDNLLENIEEISADFGGLSRREVIRKVGFKTLIALPIVASLIAPTAVNAASTCSANRCRCPNTTDNCAGNATTAPTAGGPYTNCNTTFGSPTCDCVGPYGLADSAGTGFRLSNTGCGQNP